MNHYPLSAVIPTPIGKLGLKMHEDSIAGLVWLADEHEDIPPDSRPADRLCTALIDYFQDANSLPHFPLKLEGTVFQRRVWSAMQEIPPGSTLTYGALAQRLNTGSRAVGQACRTNPIMILVPCHRVVAARGFGGYMGRAKQLQVKEWLLEHEGASCPYKIRH